jgi:hypothetical protein
MRRTIREEIMLVVPAPGNAGPTRQEVVTAVEWALTVPGPGGMQGPRRKSITDKLQRMIRDCEITEWTSGGITQNS